MKKIDERENQKNKDWKERRSGVSYSESVRAKWFCCALKLGFVQLICKTSVIFKSNLELTFSITLKERVIQVKACCGGV